MADIIVSANAIITHQLPGGGVRDIIRFVLIAWALSRTNFSTKFLLYLALASIVGTIFTLAYSYYSTGGVLKELHSVGHINHSAIFLLITYSISLSLLLFDFKSLNLSQKAFLIFTTIVLFSATVDSNSRSTFGLIVFVTIIQFLYLLFRIKKTHLTIGFFGLMFCIGFLFIQNPPEALQRIQSQGIVSLDHSHRTKINNFSYYAFTKTPLLGIGFGNYSKLEIKEIQNLIIQDKGIFDSNLYATASHSHNVYFNYLLSGGILIFSIFIWFWLYIFWIILKLLSNKEKVWIVAASFSVVSINLGIGFVNTTLHHEHAILSMFILGLLTSTYRQTMMSNNQIKLKVK
ncbi:O-antigen ligase family protein [Candidatus Pseudothioglobus singularis]|nr:O-antigen ligase family protein [Candidatus Pseudothioglobus singularis]